MTIFMTNVNFGAHEFLFGAYESPDIGNFDHTKVWRSFWTHDSLDLVEIEQLFCVINIPIST